MKQFYYGLLDTFSELAYTLAYMEIIIWITYFANI
jgi:hypothetical protein